MEHVDPIWDPFKGTGLEGMFLVNLSTVLMLTITAIIVFVIAYAGARKSDHGSTNGDAELYGMGD